MPFPNDRRWSFDANLQVGDGVAAITANGFAQNGGANGILDLGGNQGSSPKQQARIDAVMVVDITALNLAGGTPVYTFSVVGSNDPALAAGNVVLGAAQVGAVGVPTPLVTPAPPGTVEILFCTNQMGLLYEYIGLYVTVGGTAPSVTFHAFVAMLPIG
jgi:hypothetical protein